MYRTGSPFRAPSSGRLPISESTTSIGFTSTDAIPSMFSNHALQPDGRAPISSPRLGSSSALARSSWSSRSAPPRHRTRRRKRYTNTPQPAASRGSCSATCGLGNERIMFFSSSDETQSQRDSRAHLANTERKADHVSAVSKLAATRQPQHRHANTYGSLSTDMLA
jgi:hypothetical protein